MGRRGLSLLGVFALLLLCVVASGSDVAEEVQLMVEEEPSEWQPAFMETRTKLVLQLKGRDPQRLSVSALRRVFGDIDNDHDGFLSFTDLRKYFEGSLSNSFLKVMPKLVDSNRDGKVDIDEFIKFFVAKDHPEAASSTADDVSQPKPPPSTSSSPSTSDDESQPKPPSTGSTSSSPPKLSDATVTLRAKENMKEHHTMEYYQYHVANDWKMVLRRGQSFTIDIKFSGNTELPKSLLSSVSFKVNDTITVENVGDDHFMSLTWGCRGVGIKDSTLSVEVWIPGDAFIGRTSVSVVLGDSTRKLGRIAILFNPWSEFDDVQLKDEKHLQEYVVEQRGRIWYGDVVTRGLSGTTGLAWNFHQYEVLHIILDIVEAMPIDKRNDVVAVSRHFSWMLNSGGNPHGVLVGRWASDFPGGEEPTSWSGSRKIFQKYLKDGYKPVKYGQCWVFAGILTTAMRSVGIPSRPVTTFRSAHDTPQYDRVIDRKHKKESIWNFHVWVDAWMARPDVGIGKPTWNAVDATPQEISDGRYAMGPAAVDLVRKNKNVSYDNEFVIGEVNAHVWLGDRKYQAGMNYTDEEVDAEDVGQYISTKKVGCFVATENNAKEMRKCREDLTLKYKRKNASPFEFLQVGEAMGAKRFHKRHFETELTPKRPVMGSNFKVRVFRRDVSLDQDTPVRISIVVSMTSYTGEHMGLVRAFEKNCVLTNGKHKHSCGNMRHGWYLNVNVADYVSYLATTTSLRVTAEVRRLHPAALSNVNDYVASHIPGKYVWERQFSLPAPFLEVSTIPPKPRVNQPFRIAIAFRNPTPRALTGIIANIDAPDYDRQSKFKGPIKPLARVKMITKQYKCVEPGVFSLAIALDTQEIIDLYGSIDIVVSK